MVSICKVFETNLKKRLVELPKVFIQDSGILYSLLDFALGKLIDIN